MMNRFRLLALLSSFAFALTLNADDKSAWREKLETAIPEGIRLLEKKEYTTFLKAFIDAEQMKKLDGQSIEEFAVRFGQKIGPTMLKVFKEIKGATPKLEDGGNRAIYEFDIEGVQKKSITFNKIGKHWHLAE